MKTSLLTFYSIVFLLSLSACAKKDPEPSVADLGTYIGNITVVDDPQTQLGNVTNAKVKVTTSGTGATIRITGDLSFEREYAGSVISQNNSYLISISSQTKPTQKTAGGDLQIADNKLSFSLSLLNDNVSAVNPTSSQTIQISGKLTFIGSGLLKE